jgi:hypothetical protein
LLGKEEAQGLGLSIDGKGCRKGQRASVSLINSYNQFSKRRSLQLENLLAPQI